MDLFEFEEAVKNGEINDFEPYMHKQKFDVRRKILAENGIEVDRIIKRDGNQVIVNLIEQGLATERYESWKNHPSKHVREALAKQGYYPDLYINDKSPDVRKHIIYQYPKQSLKRMHNHNDRFAIRWELVRTLQNFVTENKALILNWTEQIRNIAKNYGPIEQIHMYGELYGSSVQNMEYAENLNNIRRIRFFDIHILLENNHRLALSQTDMSQIFSDDYTVPVLRTGTLSELIETAVELDSKLGGHAEGEVYKPANRYIFEPDGFDNIHYPVIKQKNERFLEKSTKSIKTPATYSEEEKAVITAVESRITKQRLLNVLSHGDIDVDPKNTGVIIKAMLEDIKSEITREEPELNLAHGQLIGKQGGKIAALFREYLSDISQQELSLK